MPLFKEYKMRISKVSDRWRQHGWIPPSENPKYQLKWKYYQDLPLEKLDAYARQEYEALLKLAKVARIV